MKIKKIKKVRKIGKVGKIINPGFYYLSRRFYKSEKVKSFVKTFILAAYCVLICAAVLFSFKSVFNAFISLDSHEFDLLQNPRYSSSSSLDSASVLAKIGSRGEDVARVQGALKNLGYYPGGVDGIFGVRTQEAVMRFQKARGLSDDGIVDPQTLKALGLQLDALSANSENDINLLARLISAESQGEPYAGQVAVGAVVLNRVKHPSFPNSISAVIYQADAFLSVKDGRFDYPVAESAYRAARDALNNVDPASGAIYYYNSKAPANSINGEWLRSRPIIATIGGHVFCS